MTRRRRENDGGIDRGIVLVGQLAGVDTPARTAEVRLATDAEVAAVARLGGVQAVLAPAGQRIASVYEMHDAFMDGAEVYLSAPGRGMLRLGHARTFSIEASRMGIATATLEVLADFSS